IKLSNGETKRLMIAAALLKNPVLLMLDSPLAGLDVQTRAEFNAIISDIIASGITVIMATSPFEIPASITHIAVLQNGTIAQQISARQFDASVFSQADKEKLDKSELTALLNTGNTPVYDWIVKSDNINITYGDKKILKIVTWTLQ